ncbi:hypothetical protein H0H93_011555 [Arthromyces matolae]|nr:hypothetical protein H0H93_011555 [Arthromyces matolae]
MISSLTGRIAIGTVSSRPFTLKNSRSSSSSSNVPTRELERHEGWLFADSVFPIQIAKWDLRHYLGTLREESLIETIRQRLEHVKTHDFKVMSLEPHEKDGGVFVRFSFTSSNPETILQAIEHDVQSAVGRYGGIPSWLAVNRGRIWMVKGTPWREDMDRYASALVQVAFEGPDIREQQLYELFRRFGRIQNISSPAPAAPGTLRSSTIRFSRIHSATIARNVLHGFHYLPNDGSGITILCTAYQRQVQPHIVRDWMSSHPKIMLPLLVFLLGTLTYACCLTRDPQVFDPIRTFMIQNKMLHRWLRANTTELLSLTNDVSPTAPATNEGVAWREREEAVNSIKAYLSDFPSTLQFIHGPQGSGKTRLLEAVLKDSGRTAMFVDCRALQNATSDTQIVASLATQTGYWPVFTFLNSVNNLIDLASVGLIGQKAGLKNSLDDQLRDILSVVGNALKNVTSSHRAINRRKALKNAREQFMKEEEERILARIKHGVWHDGRLDCVAGNGIMCELGIGDEPMLISDMTMDQGTEEKPISESARGQKNQSSRDFDDVRSLPIVVIRNYTSKDGVKQEGLLNVIAQWTAALTENQVAHVIVISDNRENAKYLAKGFAPQRFYSVMSADALPLKPLNLIAFSDADSRSSISYVQKKLRDADIEAEFTSSQIKSIQHLGGRASDLESLVHQVRNGQTVEDAVETIIARGVADLRKNAFGDDVEDAKSLSWSREQAWTVLNLLSEHDEEIALNEKIIEAAEKTIKGCEEELMTISNITRTSSWWWFSSAQSQGSHAREKYLSEKMRTSVQKIGMLEKKNAELKRTLAF